MKIYRLEFIEVGEYEVWTEEELKKHYTQEEIENFKNDDMILFEELPITNRQLVIARRKYNNVEYKRKFDLEHDIYPSLYDIIEYLYL